ncbi:hypothetical protein GCM10010116_56550 [Microbispora rosea subsp. aerata]|nr:hypothetical protein [Microbispora rosea]GGO28188.1 hypothetical protein GCM10010116_56550 [Microbispora rosea subsp. aerata]GIH56202.1 hypothetical protein Mro02_31160 [Microbispora rosea subsp. aerata]GLJ85767.1 hypothetical protein GCM10017588_45000 [Microbispora rosea subsp. aerata]
MDDQEKPDGSLEKRQSRLHIELRGLQLSVAISLNIAHASALLLAIVIAGFFFAASVAEIIPSR